MRSLTTCVFILSFLIADNSQSQSRDSLDIKIGQMLLIGFPGTSVDSAVLEEVRAGKVGSIIMFEKNIPPVNSFIALKKILWTYQQAAPIPLIISIDQEGGKVNRLKSKYGFPNTITAQAMGKSPSLDSVRFYAEATASTLAGLGINMNFAPVVDLALNPENGAIYKPGRSYSSQEDSVVLLAKEFIKQHRKYGVLTSLKHFPGHGSSKDDTHFGIADVTNTWQERELKPYEVLIDSGYADAVMSSHIVNKNLDSKAYPGTLSNSIITGILRERLNFDGVVFSDDMQMHAITKNYGLEETVKLAINAGIDILVFSNNIYGSEGRTVDKIHSIIKSMVAKGDITRERIDESYQRIMKMKNTLRESSDQAFLKQQLAQAEAQQQRTVQALRQAEEDLKAVSDKDKNRKVKKRKGRN